MLAGATTRQHDVSQDPTPDRRRYQELGKAGVSHACFRLPCSMSATFELSPKYLPLNNHVEVTKRQNEEKHCQR